MGILNPIHQSTEDHKASGNGLVMRKIKVIAFHTVAPSPPVVTSTRPAVVTLGAVAMVVAVVGDDHETNAGAGTRAEFVCLGS